MKIATSILWNEKPEPEVVGIELAIQENDNNIKNE